MPNSSSFAFDKLQKPAHKVIGHVDPDERFGGAGVQFIRDAGIQASFQFSEVTPCI